MLSIPGLLTGLAISYMFTPTYISQAELQVEGVDSTYRPVDFLMEREGEVVGEMRNRDIEFRIDTPAEAGLDRVAFHLAFAYRDPVTAQQTVQALMNRLLEWNTHGNVSFQFDVLKPPSVSILPDTPNRTMIMAAGFVSGIVLAAFVATFRRRSPSATQLTAHTA